MMQAHKESIQSAREESQLKILTCFDVSSTRQTDKFLEISMIRNDN